MATQIYFGKAVRRPHVPEKDARCYERDPEGRGYTCTARAGHSGRHSAGGSRKADGFCEVYAVWTESGTEPCS